MKKRERSLSPTTPDLVVLSLLAEGPRHGYDINAELERRDVKDWAGISRPQIYYSLHKLAEAGLVRGAVGDDPAGGPERQTFAITAAGRRALADALSVSRWAEQRPPPPFLTWLALSPHADAKAVRQVIASRRAFLEAEVLREKQTLKAMRNEDGQMVAVGMLMVDLTIRQFELELRWLSDVERWAHEL